MYRFENPNFLYFLILIPILAIAIELVKYFKTKKLNSFFSKENLGLLYSIDYKRFRIKYLLWLCSAALLIVALANPQKGDKLIEVESNQRDLFIALDVSNSMLANDVVPSRLDRAKQVLIQLIQQLDNTRFGLVLFAGKAYLQMPLTSDINAVMVFIKSANPDMVGVQGTSIGDAIRLTKNTLDQSEVGKKSMILVSDGEDHQDDFKGISSKASDQGISIITLGVGTAEGGQILIDKGDFKDLKRDENGQPVITKFDDETLKSLAKYGDGKYINISSDNNAVNEIKSSLTHLESSSKKSRYTTYDSYFQWLVGAAFLILLIEVFISNNRKTLLA